MQCGVDLHEMEQERERAHLIRTVQCNQQHAQFLRLSLRSVRRFCLHAFWAWQEYVQDVLGAKSKVALQRRVLNLELQASTALHFGELKNEAMLTERTLFLPGR